MSLSHPLRALHVIHDYLPRHQAGSEVYADHLCRELERRGLQVQVLCAEYDLSRPHGSLVWRSHEGLPVVEIINNWQFSSFKETYQSSYLQRQLEHALRMLQPDILHVHSLLNLSLELPQIAASLGIRSVATLHDFTLLCPSGGQLVHREGREICHEIDPGECARCFPRSHFAAQVSLGRLHGSSHGIAARALRFASRLGQWVPGLSSGFGPATLQQMAPVSVTPEQTRQRLDQVRRMFGAVDRFVAPSPALADYFRRFGLPGEKLEVADYGFPTNTAGKRERTFRKPLRIGFVGTLVWHKGLHVLLDAVRGLPRDDYQVLIFGDPNTFPDYARELRTLAKGLPVFFKGPYSGHDDVAKVYEQIDLLVVPSLWPENSPLVIHEAYLAGVPVVGSRLGGTVDLVRHGEWGMLFDPTVPGELAAVLRSVLEQPELLQRWARALPSVRALEEDAQWWHDTYLDVLQRPHAREHQTASA